MRHALSLHGDDEKVEAGDDLLGVDQAVDASPVAPWRLSGMEGGANLRFGFYPSFPSLSVF